MATGDLTTLLNVKPWLAIPANELASDDVLIRLITSASAFIVNYLNRPILTASYTEKYNGNGKQFLRLKAWPISAISSLKSSTDIIPVSPDGLTDGYIFDDATVYLLGPYVFWGGIQNVSIAYSAGYASVPLDVEQACIELVSLKFKERTRIGKTSEMLAGQQTTSYAPVDLSKSTKAMIQNYRNVIPS